VLKPGGRFHLMDFAKADSVTPGRIARLIHSSPRLNDNSEARLVSLTREAGLSDPKRVASRRSHAGGGTRLLSGGLERLMAFRLKHSGPTRAFEIQSGN
jgi:hypothetical protein